MSDMTSVFAEITKSSPQEDGSLLVYGNATDSTLDMDQQICDPSWLKTAMPKWFRYGNIREQHDAKRAVGKATEYEATDDGKHMITAKIVDPVARAKVEAGVFTGFSIGIKDYRTQKSAEAKNGLLISGDIVEISLVDRPCNPNATLAMCKAAHAGWEGSPADLDEERGLVKCEELTLNEEILEKTTDVDHLDAPAPGQVCADCNEDGHLSCGPTDKAAIATVEEAQAAADALLANVAGAADSIEIVKAEASADAEGVAPADPEKATDAEVVEPEFDRDAAIALVKSAADGLGQDESGDVSGADQAIALIAQLVISEAQDLAKMPAQGCDIHLLMSAVDALRCFSKREQIEQAGTDPDNMVLLAAEADVEKAETAEKAKYSAEQLRGMLAAGKAMKNPDGEPSYPIGDVEDLENAIHAVGRGKGDHDAIRSYIKGRAKALGKSNLIPDNWDTSKAADIEEIPMSEDDGPALEATKTVEPEAVKAAAFDEDGLFKSLSGDLKKADSPLHKLFKAFVEAQATALVEASAKSAAEATSDLVARLEKVESMATPGGPALRRTEVERTNARRGDLVMEAARFKALASNTEDPDLRKGYGAKAAQLEAEIKAL